MAGVGEVEGERHARLWERQQSRRNRIAEYLQHRQERPDTRVRDPFQDLAHGFGADGARDDALILQETARAIDPIPVAHAVEWIEKGFVVDQFAL
jgi:hypothetical protein